jgi:hypothetical protein
VDRRRTLARLATPAVVLLCTGLMAWAQFSFEGLYDGDSYFHTRAARELARNGIEGTFPQASVSTWSERYSDKDLAFHLLLVPFQAGDRDEDLVASGKRAAVFVALLLFAAIATALRLVAVRLAPLWILLFFSTHAAILGHLLAVRPHGLGVALLVLEAGLLVRRAGWPLFLVGMLHVYSHSSFPLLALLAASFVAVALLRREEVPWRTAGFAAGGIFAGNLVHPYFPNNLSVAWDQTVEVARNVWQEAPPIPAELFGSELVAASTRDFLACFAAWAPATVALAVLLIRRTPHTLSTEASALLVANAGLGVLSFLSARFFVFWMPLAVLLAGRLWTELSGRRSLRELWVARRRDVLLAGAVLVSILLAGQGTGSVLDLRERAKDLYTRSAERPAVEHLRARAAPGDLVYHNFWWDFSVLYHYRPDGRYVVALDPVFLFRHDPGKFDAMLQLFRGERRDAHEVIAKQFGARWVYVSRSRRSAPFVEALEADPRFVRTYADGNAMVYRVGD